MHEATIEETATGGVPANDGWFILNLAEMGWATPPGGGTWCPAAVTARRATRNCTAKYGASVAVATDSPSEPYAQRPPITQAPSPWPPH
jgi:hypothetical protein